MKSDGTPRNYSVYFFVFPSVPSVMGTEVSAQGQDHTVFCASLPPQAL